MNKRFDVDIKKLAEINGLNPDKTMKHWVAWVEKHGNTPNSMIDAVWDLKRRQLPTPREHAFKTNAEYATDRRLK